MVVTIAVKGNKDPEINKVEHNIHTVRTNQNT